jgi:hypothetical protein
MANELERLLLRFEADTTALRSALKDAESGVANYERNVDKKLANAEKHFDRMGAGIKRAMSGAAAALAANFSISALSSMVESGAKIQMVADTIGVTTQRYQELSAAALAAGVDQGQFDQAITKFSVSVSEARQQTGQLYEFLRGQAPSVLAQLKATKNTSEAMDVMAEAVRRLDTSEAKALMTKQAFGEASVYLAKALDGGKAGLDAAAASAHKYGQIAGTEAVKATQDLKIEMDQLSSTIEKTSIGLTGLAAKGLNAWVAKVKEGAKEGSAYAEVLERMSRKSNGTNPDPNKPEDRTQVDYFNMLELGQKLGFARLKQITSDGWEAVTEAPLKLQVDPRKMYPGLDAMAQAHMSAAEASGRAFDVIDMQYKQDVERFRRMLDDKTISNKQFEEARGALSEALGARIAAAYEKETAEVRALANEFKGAFTSSINSTFDAIVNGSFKATDAVKSLIQELGKVGVQRSLLGPLADGLFGKSGTEGMLTSGLNSVFGNTASGGGGWATSISLPGLAHGGPMSPNTPYLVGERGPEIVSPNTSSRVLSGWQVGGGGGNSSVYNIDARGADAGVRDQIAAALIASQRSQAANAEAQRALSRRFPTRR